ncbi:hypothetical protein F0562_032193 [Nyssa sinensis]|uniref:CRAL-TRIO domain-containing protein n=1 Tax=Nyssa sinensis TaxID=561372 RepID=A0A5J5AXV8_9ASTE|nr:hypothetical protein F0562_032193 [Nyssa sinensis]
MRDERISRQRRTTRPFGPPTMSPANRQVTTFPVKKISWDEMQRRREKGLCFYCDERFVPGHKCRSSQLLLIENIQNVEGEGLSEEDTELINDDIKTGEIPEISLHALSGWNTPRTMCIVGHIHKQPISVLIDSGSTHNFINDKVAENLHLPITPATAFPVMVANGDRLACKEKYDHIDINIQGFIFSTTLYSLPLTRIDVVLGVQWLEQLRPVLCDWKRLTMEFSVRDCGYILKGQPASSSQTVSLHMLERVVRKGAEFFALQVKNDVNVPTSDPPADVKTILQEIAAVFGEPKGLLPAREFDHRIPLKGDTSPVNVRPYRKFVKNYGIIAAPLTALLKKGQFAWNSQVEEAFNSLKQAMTTTTVLALPNFLEPFVLGTDASDKGIGAVLSQQGRPLAFLSKSLSPTKQSWSTYAKEMLAILEAIRIWHPYLLGQRFQTQTDQKSLKYLLEQRVGTPEQQKWVTKLLGYEYDIAYKPGKENSAADSLSRHPNPPTMLAISSPQFMILHELKEANRTDPFLQDLHTRVKKNPAKVPEFYSKDGLLYHRNRLVISPNSPLKSTLLAEFHDSKFGGHSSILGTFKRLSQSFYWPSMKNDIKSYVAACDMCQRNKHETQSPAGLLQPLPIPTQVWEDISLDFIDGLPPSFGHNSIMVVVDRLTKYAHFIPLTHPYTAKKVAEVFVEGIARLRAMPRSIIIEKVGPVAYRLDFPANSKLHPVFHVPNWANKCSLPQHHNMPPVCEDGIVKVEPNAILNYRWVKKGSKYVTEALVQWKSLPLEDATGEDVDQLANNFPNLNPEDKNVHQGYPTETLVLFLKAREGNVSKAHKMLVDCLNWRIQNEIDNILAKPIIPSDFYRAVRDSQLVGMSGYSKEGIPIIVIGVGLSTFDKASIHYYVQSHIQMNEYRDRVILPSATKKYGRHIGTCVKILDMTGLKLSALNHIKLLTVVSTIDDLNYPEKTDTYYIVNAPYIFSACWKVVKPLLQERSRQKVQVLPGCGRDDLLKIMDYASLPHFCKREGSGSSQHSTDDCFSLDHAFHWQLYNYIKQQAVLMGSISPIKQGSFHVDFPEPDPEETKIAETIETEFQRLGDQNGLSNSLNDLKIDGD